MNLKGVRIYDNGGPERKGGTTDRYTVCYRAYRSALANGRADWRHLVTTMSDSPYHPQGVCQRWENPRAIDRPRYSHLGRQILFADLPPDCQRVIRNDLK